MSANLFGNRFIESAGTGIVPAWHRLGFTFPADNNPGARDAMRQAGIDYRVGKFPVQVTIPKGRNGDSFDVLPTEQFALVRERLPDDNEYRQFGIVGADYTIVQNTSLATLVDSLRDQTGGRIETLGALGRGETMFLTLSTGEFAIRSDEHKSYIVIANGHNGTDALRFWRSYVRVVCQNTFNASLQGSQDNISLQHSQSVLTDANEVIRILAYLNQQEEGTKETLERMAKVPLSADTAKDMLNRVYPDPVMPEKVRLARSVDGAFDTPSLMAGEEAWLNGIKRQEETRETVLTGYERFNDSYPDTAGTGYALFNAITQYEDHTRKGSSGSRGAASALFGIKSETKLRAFKLLSDLKG